MSSKSTLVTRAFRLDESSPKSSERNMIVQNMKTATGQKAGIFIAVADVDAPQKYRVGWSKCDLSPVITNEVVYSTNENQVVVQRSTPTDTFSQEEGIRVAKRRLSGDVGKIEQDLRNKLHNADRYLPQYRRFLNRCNSYFKPTV